MNNNIPTEPLGLSDEATKWWYRTVPILVEKNPEYELYDYDNWVMLAQWYSTIMEAEQHLKEESHVVTSTKGEQSVNKWFIVREKAQNKYNELLREYGLTPLSKSKIERKSALTEKEQLDDQDKALRRMLAEY